MPSDLTSRLRKQPTSTGAWIMKLNADGTISLTTQTLNAVQLDSLLLQLAEARAQMRPEVPQQLVLTAGNLLVVVDPDLVVSARVDGSITFGLRHQGFGWLHFIVPVSKARKLQEVVGTLTARASLEDRLQA